MFSYLKASVTYAPKMKIVAAILSIFAVIQAQSIDNEAETSCEGIMVDGVYHEKEVLKTDVDRPYLLAVDRSHDILYFSYSTEEDRLQSALININTKHFQNISDVKEGIAQTVDANSHEVFIGGNDGIYKYDHNTDKVELYAAKGKDIFALYSKGVIYFTEFPSQFLYTISNDEIQRFKDLEDTKVDHFLIDKDDIMFFTNESGLYSQKKGTKDSVLIKQSESFGIRGITTDEKDDVYVCVSDGVYRVKKAEAELEKVFDIEDAFGIAFDSNNNIIYADATELVKLKPNKDKSCN